jgi:hypothetical protein
MKDAAPGTVLEGARDGAIANVKGKLVEGRDTAVTVPGPKAGKSYPGRDYEATAPQGMRISTRLILVGDRLYQIIFVRMGEKNDPFKQLVASFTLQ